jgi:hypothetical protein
MLVCQQVISCGQHYRNEEFYIAVFSVSDVSPVRLISFIEKALALALFIYGYL